MTRPLDPDDVGPAKNLNLRLPQRYHDLLEEEVQRLQQESPDLPASKSLVIRNLIRRALVEQEESLITRKGECVACGVLPPTRRSLRERLHHAMQARSDAPDRKRGITYEEIQEKIGGTKLAIAKARDLKAGASAPTTSHGRKIANLLTKKGY